MYMIEICVCKDSMSQDGLGSKLKSFFVIFNKRV